MFSLKSEIAVIGAGKVSYSLVNALTNAGLEVSLIVSRNFTSAKKLANRFKIKNFTSDLSLLVPEIKIFFLSVPDNQISLVAGKISKLDLDFKHCIFIHLSGAEDISALNALKIKGSLTSSFHLMQSFPSKKGISIKGSYVAVETDSLIAKNFLFKLASRMQLHSFKIKSKDKIYYHLAGVYSSNFLVANQYNTSELFARTKTGINYKKLFMPIVAETLNNVNKNGVLNAISGPVERADVQTIKKHLNAIRNDNVLRLNYISQSLSLLELLKKRNKKLSSSHSKLKNYLIKQL